LKMALPNPFFTFTCYSWLELYHLEHPLIVCLASFALHQA
jgi:hypothetical protein